MIYKVPNLRERKKKDEIQISPRKKKWWRCIVLVAEGCMFFGVPLFSFLFC
jgi:hypothetical protein